MRLLSPVRTSRLDAPSQWTATTIDRGSTGSRGSFDPPTSKGTGGGGVGEGKGREGRGGEGTGPPTFQHLPRSLATTDGRTFLTTVSTDRRYGCSVHTSRCAEKHCTTMFFFRRRWTIETAVKKYVHHNGPSRRSIVTVRQDGWCVQYWALQFINYNISLVCTVNST